MSGFLILTKRRPNSNFTYRKFFLSLLAVISVTGSGLLASGFFPAATIRIQTADEQSGDTLRLSFRTDSSVRAAFEIEVQAPPELTRIRAALATHGSINEWHVTELGAFASDSLRRRFLLEPANRDQDSPASKDSLRQSQTVFARWDPADELRVELVGTRADVPDVQHWKAHIQGATTVSSDSANNHAFAVLLVIITALAAGALAAMERFQHSAEKPDASSDDLSNLATSAPNLLLLIISSINAADDTETQHFRRILRDLLLSQKTQTEVYNSLRVEVGSSSQAAGLIVGAKRSFKNRIDHWSQMVESHVQDLSDVS